MAAGALVAQAQAKSAAAVAELRKKPAQAPKVTAAVDAVPVTADECGDARAIGQAAIRGLK